MQYCTFHAYSKRTNEFSFVNSLVLQQNCNLPLFHFVLQLFSHVNIKPFLDLLLSFLQQKSQYQNIDCWCNITSLLAVILTDAVLTVSKDMAGYPYTAEDIESSCNVLYLELSGFRTLYTENIYRSASKLCGINITLILLRFRFIIFFIC